MRGQCSVDLCKDSGGQPLVAHAHDWLEGMGAGLERAALGGRKCGCGSLFSHGDTVRQAMTRSKSSKAWMKRHVSDPYVQKAKAQGYRSRAAFKLEQIDAKDRLFRAGSRVVDLGAAPGGWSQLALSRVGSKGVVVAVDL